MAVPNRDKVEPAGCGLGVSCDAEKATCSLPYVLAARCLLSLSSLPSSLHQICARTIFSLADDIRSALTVLPEASDLSAERLWTATPLGSPTAFQMINNCYIRADRL